MVGFRPSVALAYTGEYCATQSQRVSVARLLRGVIPGNIGAMVRAINGTTAVLCNELDDITEDDLAPVPWEGGQCCNGDYSVEAVINTITVGGTTYPGSTRTQTGVGQYTKLNLVYGFGSLGSPSTALQWSRTLCDGTIQSGIRGSVASIQGTASGSISITRRDGLPDDCGNPPREFPDPLEPLPLPPIDFTWENNQGVTVNATANITLSPAISIEGNISFPVDIEIGDLTFNGNFNLDGSFNFSPTVNINPPGSPPTIGPSLPGDLPADPDESRSVLAGVAITVQTFGPAVTVINAITAPNLVVPRAASVNFLVDVEGDEFWSSDLDAKNGDCFVPCPPDVVCIDAAVTPYPGVELTWQRVYREERVGRT